MLLSADPPVIPVPVQTANLKLAYAMDGAGGYKVPSLISLERTAPSLHDDGVAAATQDQQLKLGMVETVMAADAT